MTSLLTLCEDYIVFRRSLGAKLMMTHGLLLQFIAFLAQRKAPFITAALALEWASKPQGVQQEWRARRLSEVRQFARYVHALDPRHEIPPQRLLPYRRQRPQPYIYSDGEIEDLIGAARDLSGRLRPQTCSTMLSLLAVTGMRSGEVVGLDRDDVDLRHGILMIRESKFGKSRLNLCHDTTVQALGDYAAWRDEHCGISPTARLPSGSSSAAGPGVTGSCASGPSLLWHASCLSRCGGTHEPAWCRRAQCWPDRNV